MRDENKSGWKRPGTERDGGHDCLISDQSRLYNMATIGRPQSVVCGARV